KDRGQSSQTVAVEEAHGDVTIGGIAEYFRAVPLLGVPDVVDRDVIVRTPEEGHMVKALSRSEGVARRGLTLTLGDHPVLDADARARVRVGPARDVARRIDSRCAGLQTLVDDDAIVDSEYC